MALEVLNDANCEGGFCSVVTPCIVVSSNQLFHGTCCLQLQEKLLKSEATVSSGTLINS
jgi:hypothetical protein